MDSEKPERDAAERALRHRDEDAALYGGANDVGESGEQRRLLLAAQRNGLPDSFGQRFAVTQQEEQQIKHDAEADHEVERVHSDAERLRGENLPARHEAGRELFAKRRQVGEIEPLDQSGGPGRQRVEYPLQVAAEIVLTRLDFRDKA